jgi:hypothetical protein
VLGVKGISPWDTRYSAGLVEYGYAIGSQNSPGRSAQGAQFADTVEESAG